METKKDDKKTAEKIAEELKMLSIFLFLVVSINLTERIMRGDKKFLPKKQDEKEVKDGKGGVWKKV